jgi:hypothetical protein
MRYSVTLARRWSVYNLETIDGDRAGQYAVAIASHLLQWSFEALNVVYAQYTKR